MNFILGIILSFITVLVLVFVPFVGMQVANLQVLFGVIIPYLAMITFLVGVVGRLLLWSFSPVPFRIPTTAGQQKSFPWIKHSKLENPSTAAGVFGRMVLEVLLFRSLFRNSTMEFREGPRVTYEWEKWLWLSAILFHYSFLVVLIRHLRFFTNPVPGFVNLVEFLDGFMQTGIGPIPGLRASRHAAQRRHSVGRCRLFTAEKGLYSFGPLYLPAHRLFPPVFDHGHCHHRDSDALPAESGYRQRQGIGHGVGYL